MRTRFSARWLNKLLLLHKMQRAGRGRPLRVGVNLLRRHEHPPLLAGGTTRVLGATGNLVHRVRLIRLALHGARDERTPRKVQGLCLMTLLRPLAFSVEPLSCLPALLVRGPRVRYIDYAIEQWHTTSDSGGAGVGYRLPSRGSRNCPRFHCVPAPRDPDRYTVHAKEVET